MEQQFTVQLEQLAIQELPAIIDRVRAAFVKSNPGAPVPTKMAS